MKDEDEMSDTTHHIDTGAELVVVDHVTVDTAIDWMTRQGDKPFSIYINFQATHFPYRLQRGVARPPRCRSDP